MSYIVRNVPNSARPLSYVTVFVVHVRVHPIFISKLIYFISNDMTYYILDESYDMMSHIIIISLSHVIKRLK